MSSRPIAPATRNPRIDAMLVLVGAIIMLLTWPEPGSFRRGAPIMDTLPVVVVGFLVARGVIGRPLTGDANQISKAIGVGIITILLLVCWRQLDG